MALLIVAGIVLASSLIYFVVSSQNKSPANGTFPPGPPGLPVLGNLLSIPSRHSWLQFFAWSKQYGPLYRLNIAGREHFIVSSEKIANDLLRDRGNIYSSREQLPAAVGLLSDNLRPLFWPSGEETRQGRKLMHQLCQPSSAAKYEPTQVLESIRLLEDLIRKPQDYERWFMRYSAGLIFRLGFGRILEENDPLLDRIYRVVHNVERVASPGAYVVDVLPWMRHLPDAIAPFKRELKALHVEELDVFRTLLRDTRQSMARGDAAECWEKVYLENQDRYRLTEDQGAYVVGTLFEAGAGTTAAAMMSFVLAMVLHPQAYAKLQKSIESVVGSSRLPGFEDIPQLPYVRAVVKEVLRWRPVTAGGIPHMSTKDDTYISPATGKTYFIPAGTNVHPNQWAIHRDETLYPNPESFIPERWLDPEYPTYREPLDTFPNVQHFSSFGFGRRICPGMHIAERSMYLLSARIAWACNVSKAKDPKTGEEMEYPEYDYVEGFNVQPNPFPFELDLRDEERGKIVQDARIQADQGDPLKN
ncbi:cytochrome P450 [Lecanosticta acicola]|uniref:Cytochrome P450 n=1 Tax=Lecanosticta acicola TaxID=111012 RepID=A0AAI8Z7B6_9PEZI|nr:cytochrome P450 [Lecanosticta acicola]